MTLDEFNETHDRAFTELERRKVAHYAIRDALLISAALGSWVARCYGKGKPYVMITFDRDAGYAVQDATDADIALAGTGL